jgi:hypothetical protein
MRCDVTGAGREVLVTKYEVRGTRHKIQWAIRSTWYGVHLLGLSRVLLQGYK